MKLSFAGILLVCLVVAAVPAAAQNLYNNGPTDGQDYGWTINFGYAGSDQFPLPWPAPLWSVQFAAWLFPGDVLETVQVSITSSEFGGTSFFDQTLSFSASNCMPNHAGFNVCTETAYVFLYLDAGNYWLNLSNAVVRNGDPVYWDQNSGPSLASDSALGTIPSESFTIGGVGSGPPPPTSPEPGSLLLFASGVATLLGFLGALRPK